MPRSEAPNPVDLLAMSMRNAAGVSLERDGQLVPVAGVLGPGGIAFFTPDRMVHDVEKERFVEYLRQYAKDHDAMAICFIVECWHTAGDADGFKWLEDHGTLVGYPKLQEGAFLVINTRHGTELWRADIVRADKVRLGEWKHDPMLSMFGAFSNLLRTVAEA
jgi:hypothetical protein